ncbi:MAG: lamin tail domain-containing protein [Planctomycetota bacterium]|nr:MAG: lamin tail domain-containing protein [Planctomycetota bacterium]
MRPRPLASSLALIGLLLSACDTGTREDPRPGGSTAAPATAATPPAAATPSSAAPLAAAPTAAAAAPASAVLGPDPVVALAFELRAGASAIDLAGLDVAASGSIDERDLGDATLFDDTNANGLLDAGEAPLAVAPALTTDDGTYSFALAPPVRIAAGTVRHFLVAVDATPLTGPALAGAAGKNLVLTLPSAAAVLAYDANGPVSPGGSFPIEGRIPLAAGEHVLISEVVTGPGSGVSSQEYIELFNPTAQAVDLSDHYLSDFTDDPLTGRFYWKLPTGRDFGPAAADFAYDFVVRFPPGARIAPGQVITVALDGQGFLNAYGQSADYCLRNRGSSSATPMLAWDGVAPGANFVAADVHASVGLTGPAGAPTGNGESVFLFRWDGVSDLIVDVDLINYGSASATNAAVNKSPGQQATNPGAPDVSVDSAFDNDATPSTFQDDADDLFQLDHRAPLAQSIERVDFREGSERRGNGNGEAGHDETSEPFGDGLGGAGTFQVGAAPTPGRLP